jgi:hypothetical protein
MLQFKTYRPATIVESHISVRMDIQYVCNLETYTDEVENYMTDSCTTSWCLNIAVQFTVNLQ